MAVLLSSSPPPVKLGDPELDLFSVPVFRCPGAPIVASDA
jgi:hypothetical protein